MILKKLEVIACVVLITTSARAGSIDDATLTVDMHNSKIIAADAQAGKLGAIGFGVEAGGSSKAIINSIDVGESGKVAGTISVNVKMKDSTILVGPDSLVNSVRVR